MEVGDVEDVTIEATAAEARAYAPRAASVAIAAAV
jgi:hypothetical protein